MSGASPSLAQPGQDAGMADPPAAVEVTVGAAGLRAPLVPLGAPHIQGSPSIPFTLLASPQVVSRHLGQD